MHVQAARKNAGLNVDDRILLQLTTQDNELQTAIAEHSETIQAEVLAAALDDVSHAYTTEARVDEAGLTVSLEKA